jgi:hypothetical protein
MPHLRYGKPPGRSDLYRTRQICNPEEELGKPPQNELVATMKSALAAVQIFINARFRLDRVSTLRDLRYVAPRIGLGMP